MKNKKGHVLKAIASFFYVYVKEDDKLYECRASKKLKLNKKAIIAGDIVVFTEQDKYIIDIEKRENELIRPKIANIKNGLLVFSTIEPKINYGLLDRMILILEMNELNIEIAISKTDIMTEEETTTLKTNLNYYKEIGYNIYYINEKGDFNKLREKLKSRTTLLTGQSGVGKSTLINNIDGNLKIKTAAISKALGRGKHTTRETTFYSYYDGYIIDSPGFSSLEIPFKKEEIRDNYVDYIKISIGCRFNGCYHLKEPNCAVKEVIDKNEITKTRYENYVKLMNETEK